MLRIDNLGKHYDKHPVFQGLTLSIPSGCLALCDEDNTGKSTLLNIIAGQIRPDAGDVWINGHSMVQSPAQAQSHLAFVPDNCLMFPEQTGRARLEQVATEKASPLNDDVFDFAHRLGLTPHLDKRFEQMSTGTRRKVFLTAAVIGNPAVIIADGPGNGLDTPARAALAEQFRLWAQDRVVLFASHDAELVQACQASPRTIAELCKTGNF